MYQLLTKSYVVLIILCVTMIFVNFQANLYFHGKDRHGTAVLGR